MKKFLIAAFAILTMLFCANANARKIVIFACEPEWSALAREIVGDNATILTATFPTDNPSLKIGKTIDRISMMMKADMVFCSGGGLEKEWLLELLLRSSSRQIKSGEGILMAFDYVKPLNSKVQVDNVVSRVHLDPNNLFEISKKFLEMAIKIDSLYNVGLSASNAGTFNYNHQVFVKKLTKLIQNLEEKSQPLKDVPVIVRNDAWAYLINWLGLKVVGTIEDENGRDKDIRKLEAMVKENKPEMILFADYEKKEIIFELSRRTKTRVVFLPFTVGGVVGVSNIYSLYKNIVSRLLTDCSKTVCKSIGGSKAAMPVRKLSDYISTNNTIIDQQYDH